MIFMGLIVELLAAKLDSVADEYKIAHRRLKWGILQNGSR